MKIITRLILTIFIPYGIFVSNLELDVKILLYSFLCAAVLYFYIFKAGGWRKLSNHGRVLSSPTLILVGSAVLNVLLNLNIGVFYFIVGFIVLTILSFVVSSVFGFDQVLN